MNAEYLNSLSETSKFNRAELMKAMNASGMKISDSMFKVVLKRLLDTGAIVRIGRNSYCVGNESIRIYEHIYSEQSLRIAELIQQEFPYLDFSIFEMVQLNTFLNHQLAHNTIFLSVEADLGDFVFEKLKENYPGKVLLAPSMQIYHQYWSDGMIVIQRLISEAPRGKREKWHTCIEKMMVDVFCEPILKASFSQSELPEIYEEAFSRYVIDESCMLRYAARRGASEKLKKYLINDTNVILRTV